MDTISLHQAGFDSAVASLGTSLTPEHAQLLSRYFPEAIIAYDGDGAGVSAAQRAIPLLERAGMKVRVLRVTGPRTRMSSSSSLDGTPFSVCWTRVKTRWTTAWSRSEKNTT